MSLNMKSTRETAKIVFCNVLADKLKCLVEMNIDKHFRYTMVYDNDEQNECEDMHFLIIKIINDSAKKFPIIQNEQRIFSCIK